MPHKNWIMSLVERLVGEGLIVSLVPLLSALNAAALLKVPWSKVANLVIF